MITNEKLHELLTKRESEMVERTVSFSEDKLGPAVCAISNNFGKQDGVGYVLLGVNDDGSIAGKKITDEDLQKIGGVRSNGNVLPIPTISVSEVFHFPEGDVVVVEVEPSYYPPVRYNGVCWIRIGPRQARATPEEERMLAERRSIHVRTFDQCPVFEATLDDLAADYFQLLYLPKAIDKETLAQNGRTIKEQLASLRFYDSVRDCPTMAGLLMFGKNPKHFIAGSYIQYVRFAGENGVVGELDVDKTFAGPLVQLLQRIDDFIQSVIVKERLFRDGSFQERRSFNYPHWALREFVMNAIMHRDYESNAPIRLYEYPDRIEIWNPGGLYGKVNRGNFPEASDYRNVALSEGVMTLGLVNKFNYGIRNSLRLLKENGNDAPVFQIDSPTDFKVTIPINKEWKKL